VYSCCLLLVQTASNDARSVPAVSCKRRCPWLIHTLHSQQLGCCCPQLHLHGAKTHSHARHLILQVLLLLLLLLLL
jgi:hypothetical protein